MLRNNHMRACVFMQSLVCVTIYMWVKQNDDLKKDLLAVSNSRTSQGWTKLPLCQNSASTPLTSNRASNGICIILQSRIGINRRRSFIVGGVFRRKPLQLGSPLYKTLIDYHLFFKKNINLQTLCFRNGVIEQLARH